MRRAIYSFESIPSLSNIFWNIPYYKNNVLENNKKITLNLGEINEINKKNERNENKNDLSFMCDTRFKQHFNRIDQSTYSWLNMVGNLNNNRFKLYESCYFQNNPLAGYISLDYSLLWLDIISNEPFYSPVSQELSTKLKDKVSVSLSLKYDIRQEDIENLEYENTISEDFWVLLTTNTQDKLHHIENVMIQNREKSIVWNQSK